MTKLSLNHKKDPSSYEEQRQRFLLRREKLVMWVGLGGLSSIALGALFLPLSNNAIPVLLALITAFGGVLGLPTVLRWDESRRGGEK